MNATPRGQDRKPEFGRSGGAPEGITSLPLSGLRCFQTGRAALPETPPRTYGCRQPCGAAGRSLDMEITATLVHLMPQGEILKSGLF